MLASSGTVFLGSLLLFWVPAKRRKRLMMMVALLVLGGSFAVGCGGSSSTKTTVQGTGNFTYTVTGTDAATGALVSKTIVTVTVQ
jgi:hypothetical protein